MTDAEKLLGKLTRAADALRWFLWMDRHLADVMTIDGVVKVSAMVDGHFFLTEGKSLSEAMAAMEDEIATRRREATRWATWQRQMKEGR